MEQVIARIDFKVNGVDYLQGEHVDVKSYEEVVKLNALGFIEPLTHRQLVLIRREFEKKEVKHEL